MEININTLKELIDLINMSSVGKLNLETKEFKLTIEKQLSAETQTVQQLQISASAAPIACVLPETEKICGNVVVSPIVGTFYASASPDKPPFVKVGQQVKKGDTLFIIESMKLMNEITSDFEGTVTEILAENGRSLEYGQPVMRIE